MKGMNTSKRILTKLSCLLLLYDPVAHQKTCIVSAKSLATLRQAKGKVLDDTSILSWMHDSLEPIAKLLKRSLGLKLTFAINNARTLTIGLSCFAAPFLIFYKEAFYSDDIAHFVVSSNNTTVFER